MMKEKLDGTPNAQRNIHGVPRVTPGQYPLLNRGLLFKLTVPLLSRVTLLWIGMIRVNMQ